MAKSKTQGENFISKQQEVSINSSTTFKPIKTVNVTIDDKEVSLNSLDTPNVNEILSKSQEELVFSSTHNALLSKSLVETLAKKHDIPNGTSIDEILKHPAVVQELSEWTKKVVLEDAAYPQKAHTKEEREIDKLIDLDNKLNVLIDRCSVVLTNLVKLNNECDEKIEEANTLVEQFNAQREAVQSTEVVLNREKFKVIVDAYQAQAEKSVSDARSVLASIKNLDTSDLTAIKKELNAITRGLTKQEKNSENGQALLNKAANCSKVIEIQRKQVLSCANKNEKKLSPVKMKLQDYKKTYGIVLDELCKA